jgi:hypothetical protein
MSRISKNSPHLRFELMQESTSQAIQFLRMFAFQFATQDRTTDLRLVFDNTRPTIPSKINTFSNTRNLNSAWIEVGQHPNDLWNRSRSKNVKVSYDTILSSSFIGPGNPMLWWNLKGWDNKWSYKWYVPVCVIIHISVSVNCVSTSYYVTWSNSVPVCLSETIVQQGYQGWRKAFSPMSSHVTRG